MNRRLAAPALPTPAAPCGKDQPAIAALNGDGDAEVAMSSPPGASGTDTVNLPLGRTRP